MRKKMKKGVAALLISALVFFHFTAIAPAREHLENLDEKAGYMAGDFFVVRPLGIVWQVETRRKRGKNSLLTLLHTPSQDRWENPENSSGRPSLNDSPKRRDIVLLDDLQTSA